MLNPKTPGVFIQEVSTLPASVAPVATAIPAFVGYTEKRGDGFPVNTPTRITSMVEYEAIFGGPFDENYEVTIADGATNDDPPVITVDDSSLSPYLLYYNMQMYFSNGGGPCYVISVGTYDFTTPSVDGDLLKDGVDAVSQEDEPTLLVVPEAVMVGDTARNTLHTTMLAQCRRLQDRFTLMDVLVDAAGSGSTVKEDGDYFRNNEVNLEYLNYGAAYYPSLKTSFIRYYTEGTVNISDTRGTVAADRPFDGESLSVLKNGSSAAAQRATATITITSGFRNLDDPTTTFIIGAQNITIGTGNDQFEIGDSAADTATNLAAAITAVNATADGSVITLEAGTPGVAGNETSISFSGSSGARLSGSTLEGGSAGGDSPDLELYGAIKTQLDSYRMTLYPSSAIAGVYARVDRNRGVWKAPANVSVNSVSSPTVLVTDDEQGGLNVDPTAGKSINVIRNFTGKGTLVWGARTLAGNDNEWRYVPVRRLFIFIEESIQKATEPTVFEPNDANTWTKLRTLIENFLASLWREGALAGASPADAFFVKVGLGETMTALDILEGRLNVEIGIAAVRPAEFIILKFSHKLQE
ncbi:MAG: phage tail sheath C-terminal domain-containing protein [Bacteroidota bacterium]